MVQNDTRSTPEGELQYLPLHRLHAHPSNANVMSNSRRAKLARHIAREGRYPPLIVRPHPEVPGDFQLLDGHQRCQVLRRLGQTEGLCLLWPCDDAEALTLLATLNRLEGTDDPKRRAGLVADLQRLIPAEQLTRLLPEDDRGLRKLLEATVDSDALRARLRGAGSHGSKSMLSLTIAAEDQGPIEAAIEKASRALGGRPERGAAVAAICRAYLAACDD